MPPSDQELTRTERQYSEPCIWKCNIIACITAPCPPCIWRCEPIPTPSPREVYNLILNLIIKYFHRKEFLDKISPCWRPCEGCSCGIVPGNLNPGSILQGQANNGGYDYGRNGQQNYGYGQGYGCGRK